MEMDRQKTIALFKWVQILLDNQKIENFDGFDDGKLLLDLLKLIDKDVWTGEYVDDPSGRLECIFTYLEGLYGDLRDAVNKTAILAGNNLETAKLLVVTLVAAVDSENVQNFVEPIMALSKTNQMNLMSIISPINERLPEKDLNELLQDVLCNAVTAEGSQLVKSPSSFICSPGATYSPYPSFVGSPAICHHVRNNSHSSSIGADSPFRFVGSPKIINKKELFEKNKLNVRIRRLNSNITTQGHIIDDLEHRLDESKKKNDMLENMNKDLNTRVKSLLRLQDDVDSLRMAKIELETKDSDIERMDQKLDKALRENSLLSNEIWELKKQLELEQEEKISKLDCFRQKVDKLQSNEDALKVRNAELSSSLEIKEEEFRRVTEEKDQQCKELLDHLNFLKEKLSMVESPNANEDEFVVIGENQKCLKNELYVVTLEEDLKKANEELKGTKEKHESARKQILELKNDLNENKLANLAVQKELEAKSTAFDELKETFEKDGQSAKEREEKFMFKISEQESSRTELENRITAIQDEAYALKREKEEMIIISEREKDKLLRSLQEEQIKLQSIELEVTNLNAAKDELERACKEQTVEFNKKIGRVEEKHDVECYKLKDEFQKKISELEIKLSDNANELVHAQETYNHLHKAKRADDEIYLTRISALVEEREQAVNALKAEFDQKSNASEQEKTVLENELTLVKNENKEAETVNKTLQETVANIESELHDCRKQLEDAENRCEEKTGFVVDLEKELEHSKEVVGTFNAEIDCLKIKCQTEMEQVRNLEEERKELREKIDFVVCDSKEKIAEFERVMDSLNNEIVVLNSKVEEKEDEIRAKNCQLDEERTNADSVQFQLQENNSKISEQLYAVQEERIELSAKFDERQKELEAMTMAYGEFRETACLKMSRLEEEFDSVKDDKLQMEAKNIELKKELEAVNDILERKGAEISLLTEEIVEKKATEEHERAETLKKILQLEKSNNELFEEKRLEMQEKEKIVMEIKEEYEKKMNAIVSRSDFVEAEKTGLIQKLEDAAQSMFQEKEQMKIMEEKVKSITIEYESKICQMKQKMANLDSSAKEDLARAIEAAQEKETENAAILKEFNLKLSERDSQIEDLRISNDVVQESLRKECLGLEETAGLYREKLHDACQEVKRYEREVATLEGKLKNLSMQMESDAKTLAEKSALEAELNMKQLEAEKEHAKAMELKVEEFRKCYEEEKSRVIQLQADIESQRVGDEEKVNSLMEMLKKEREDFCKERVSLEESLNMLKLASDKMVQTNNSRIQELTSEIGEIRRNNEEQIKAVSEKFITEKEEMLKKQKMLIEEIDVEKERVCKAVSQVESEIRQKNELKEEMEAVIEGKKGELEEMNNVHQAEKEEFKKIREQLQNDVKTANEKAIDAEAKNEDERQQLEDIKVKLDLLVTDSGDQVKNLAAKYEAEKEELVNTQDSLKEQLKTVRHDLKEASDLLQDEKEESCNLKVKMEKIILGKNVELAEMKMNFENEKSSLTEQLNSYLEELKTAEENVKINEEHLESVKNKLILIQNEREEINKVNDNEREELAKKFQADKEELHTKLESLKDETVGLREELKIVTEKLEVETLRVFEQNKVREAMVSCHEEEIRQLGVEKETLKKELSSVKENLMIVEEKNAEFVQKISENKIETENVVQSHVHEITALSEQKKNSLDMLEDLKGQLESKCDEINEERETLRKLKMEKEELIIKYDFVNKNALQCKEDLVQANKELVVMRQEIAALKSTAEDNKREISVTVENLEREKEDLAKQVADLTKNVELKESVIEKQDEEMRVFSLQLVSIEKDKIHHEKMAQEEIKEREVLKVELHKVKEEKDELERIIENQEERRDTLQGKLESIEEEKMQKLKVIDLYEEELKCIKEHLETLTDQKNRSDEVFVQMKKIHEEEKHVLCESLEKEKLVGSGHEEELCGFKDKIELLMKENASLREDNIKSKSESSDFQKKITELEDAFKTFISQNEKDILETEEGKMKTLLELERAKKALETMTVEAAALKEKLGQLEAQSTAEMTTKTETLAMFNAKEDEYKSEIRKCQEEVVEYEIRIATMEKQSDERISDLQLKLKETSRERSQIEAEKVEYQSRLIDMEASKHALEKSAEAAKKKLRTDILRLMKDYEEKESAFDEEKLLLQKLADHANKDLEEKKRHLAQYETKIKIVEAELAKTKSLLQSKETELAKNTLPLNDANEKTDVATRSSRRRTMLPIDFATPGDASDLSFEEQSTLVCDEVTLKRSPSLRSLNMDQEETFGGSITSLESVESTHSNFSRSRSLRRQSGIHVSNARRRSLLYMAGKTPPERRTTLSVPLPHIPACQMEDEPDILESKGFGDDFGRISEFKRPNLHDDFDRMSELKRRNTLCLPHLKSSYPLEVIKAKEIQNARDAEYEVSLRNGLDDTKVSDLDLTRKRVSNEIDVVPPRKRKPLESSSFVASKGASTRHVKSDSNIMTRAMINQGSQMIWGDGSRIKEESVLDVTSDPRRESVAFTVDFDEPNKKLKPRASMRRSRGSAHLIATASKESLFASQDSISAKPVGKSKSIKSKPSHSEKIAAKDKENQPENVPHGSKSTPLKRSQSDKTSLKSRTNNLRKSIRKSITSKVRGAKAAF